MHCVDLEAMYAASGRGNSPDRNASEVYGGVSEEACADRNRRVFGMQNNISALKNHKQ
jgi:hypothetical protein